PRRRARRPRNRSALSLRHCGTAPKACGPSRRFFTGFQAGRVLSPAGGHPVRQVMLAGRIVVMPSAGGRYAFVI
ncbi:hypothetical protein ACFQ08_12265, partial [Streptosporangium algeriense]